MLNKTTHIEIGSKSFCENGSKTQYPTHQNSKNSI